MITSVLLDLIYAFIWLMIMPVRLFPDVALPAAIGDAIAQASTYLSMVDAVFPISTFVSVLALVIVVDGSIFTYKIIMWVIRKIPGIG